MKIVGEVNHPIHGTLIVVRVYGYKLVHLYKTLASRPSQIGLVCWLTNPLYLYSLLISFGIFSLACSIQI